MPCLPLLPASKLCIRSWAVRPLVCLLACSRPVLRACHLQPVADKHGLIISLHAPPLATIKLLARPTAAAQPKNVLQV